MAPEIENPLASASPRTIEVTYPELAERSALSWLQHQSETASLPLSTWPSVVYQVDPSLQILSDGQFVYGPNVAGFNLAAFLNGQNSPLQAYVNDIDAWARYTTVNPKVLLTVLELRFGYVTADTLPDREQVLQDIEHTAMDLAVAFYEHLYTWGSRRPSFSLRSFILNPTVAFADGSSAQIQQEVPSGGFAIAAAMAQTTDLNQWIEIVQSNQPDSFSAVFGAMFPATDPLSTANDINPPSAPPNDLFQFPFPLGAKWNFGGPHSWVGDSTPPFSSMDFFSGGATCAEPPYRYTVAAAGGTAYRPYGYDCWIEIDHGGGWVTSYYHLVKAINPAGQTLPQNSSLARIGCTVCAGGYATGPHVHWTLKYNGSYVSLEGVKISGWTIHVGTVAYNSGYIERDGVTLNPWSSVVNDYHIYYPQGDFALRFYGNGTGDIDRVKIRLDDPFRPVDVGANDFTIEWWMKAFLPENSSPACVSGGDNWIYGNIIFDRDVFGNGDYGDYGISLARGRIAFGVNNGTSGTTLCGTTRITDGYWHHIAVTRRASDGLMSIYIDGVLDAQVDGPDGNISYRNRRTTSYPNDPFLVIGAEKHDAGPEYPSFSGWLDEIRFSNIVRYTSTFSRPTAPFVDDRNTVALYHLDEGSGNAINDVSGFGAAPSNGTRFYGGSPAGPEWTTDTAFNPVIATFTPTGTATPTETGTPTSTVTSTITPTPTVTSTPTITPTPTITATPTITTTPTITMTPTITPTSTPGPIFGDVPLSHWANAYIEALYEAGYIAGCSTDPRLYCPDNIMTRAEVAVFVVRGVQGAGYLPPQPGTQTFTDLQLSSWAAKWVEELFTSGFTAGCNTDPLMFCPWQGNTRAQGSVFFLRMMNGVDYIPPEPDTQIFDDVPLGQWYTKWVHAAYEAGLLEPCQDTGAFLFCPNDPLTRDWAAFMMVQAKGGLPLP